MRKLATSPFVPDRPYRGRSGRRVVHVLFALCIALLVAPLAYEVGAVCAANWRAMSGRIDHVETPILDSMAMAWSGSIGMLQQRARGAHRLSMPWRPSMVIGLAFGWALFMGIPLRRSH